MGVFMNIFERLLRLYKVHKESGKTPLEDFVTEVLAGILQTNQSLRDSFVNEVLLIEGSNFKVSTQIRYSLPDDVNCIIDLVFENEDSICFLENKVMANEGDRQLERYATVLENIKQQSGQNVYLRYCTKMYDPKSVQDIDFYQFRWQRVYEFMKKQEESELITSFLELLRSENMAGTSDFNVGDIMVLKGMIESISKMDEVLDLAKPSFIKFFGQPYQRDYERLKQIPRFNRFSLWTTEKIRNSELEIMIGFEFDNIEDHKAPTLFVQVECYDDSMKKLFKPLVQRFDYNDLEDGDFLVWFEEPLTNFLSMKNQKEKMVTWYVEKMGEVKKVFEEIDK
jgi:hypothetical protein